MTPAELAPHSHFLFLLLAIGGIGGFLSGLLGMGGGIIFVPALYFFLSSYGIDPGIALKAGIGTSLALVLTTGLSSTFWHQKKDAVDFSILRKWALPAVLGVLTGAFFASSLDGAFLKRIFALLTVLVAGYMAFAREPETEAVKHRVSAHAQKMLAFIIGTISAMLGLGGAIMNIPLLIYIGVPVRKAFGTGGALGSVIALPGTIGYILSGLYVQNLPPYSLGYVNLACILVILPVCLLLSPVGVHVSHLLPRKILRRVFAVLLIFVAVQMLRA